MKKLKICFICSSGGHLFQLFELSKSLKGYEHYFVNLDREHSRTVLRDVNSYYLRGVNKKKPLRIFGNFFDSLRIFLKNKPDVVISNGGGMALATCYIAKIFGKKVIFIESFARITERSLFGKLVSPIADLTIVQWKQMLTQYKNSKYGGPIFDFNIRKTKKKKQIFVTVGSTDFPFNRLIEEIDNLVKGGFISYKVVAQIGNSTYMPKNYAYFEFLPYTKMSKFFNESEIVITHAGTASIMDALFGNAKVIVVPRYEKFAEHVDDHQVQITIEFEKKRLVLVAYQSKDLKNKLEEAKNFKPDLVNKKSKAVGIIKKFFENNT